MTKKLENLFNLPEATEPVEETTAPVADIDIQQQNKILEEVNSNIDKIDAALPHVMDLERGDAELDELAEMAKNSAKDLLDLGMNMEARFSGTVFQTAGVLLGHAITAKQAKLDKKLRMVDLQLKKMRLDHQTKPKDNPDLPIDGEGHILDRNELLQMLNKQR